MRAWREYLRGGRTSADACRVVTPLCHCVTSPPHGGRAIAYEKPSAVPGSFFSPGGEAPSVCEAMRGLHGTASALRAPSSGPAGHLLPAGEKREPASSASQIPYAIALSCGRSRANPTPHPEVHASACLEGSRPQPKPPVLVLRGSLCSRLRMRPDLPHSLIPTKKGGPCEPPFLFRIACRLTRQPPSCRLAICRRRSSGR